MSYEYITYYDSPNFGYPRGTKGQNKPEFIIIHHWGSLGQKFTTPVNYLCSKHAMASAHFVAEENKVACIVDCNDSAWHVAETSEYNAYVNMHSIGIECRPECTEGDFDTVAQLIADIWEAYGKLPLKGHQDFNSHGYPTGCPGKWYSRLDELYKRAEMYYYKTKPSIYHVQIGAFRVRKYAEDMKAKAKAKGFDAFIVEDKDNEH